MGVTAADISAYAGRNRFLSPLAKIVKPLVFRMPPARLIALAGRRTAGLPLGTAGAKLTGSTVRENLTDARTQFETLERSVYHFRPDGIGILADLSIEAEACGCEISFPEFGLPYVVTHPVKNNGDTLNLRLPDPGRDGRMPVVIETLRMLSRRFGLPIGGGGIGPYTLAGELAGAQELALGTITRPRFAHSLMEYTTGVVIDYNRAQLEAGADTVVIAEPAGSILSPRAFEEFSGGYLARIVDALPAPVTLHVCGDVGHLVEELVEAGPDGLSFDAPVDLTLVAEAVPPSIVMSGNLDPVDVVLGLKPPEIREATIELLDSMRPFPNFVLSTGCDIAPETPLENIECIVETVRGYRPGRQR